MADEEVKEIVRTTFVLWAYMLGKLKLTKNAVWT